MNIYPLGKISVPAPGTPVQVITGVQLVAQIGFNACSKILFRPCISNAGTTYIGKAGMNKSTYSGVAFDFTKPAATGVNESVFLHSDSSEGNQLDPTFWYVDAAASGDGVLVSLVVA